MRATRRFFFGGSAISLWVCASSLALARLPVLVLMLDDSLMEVISPADGIEGSGALRFAGVGDGVMAGEADG